MINPDKVKEILINSIESYVYRTKVKNGTDATWIPYSDSFKKALMQESVSTLREDLKKAKEQYQNSGRQ